ncbi:MAG: hypothetical protein EAZ61_05400 [Oscillatoriales cyanobacterium]|jgi:hypothetical protein|nr:MAG: hypothetical protein EAZ61_05400 [Oscillatoriales cyanobacterium]
MTNSFQDKILRSSIPVSIKLEAKTVDLDSHNFYTRLSLSATVAISLAQSFTEIYAQSIVKPNSF